MLIEVAHNLKNETIILGLDDDDQHELSRAPLLPHDGGQLKSGMLKSLLRSKYSRAHDFTS